MTALHIETSGQGPDLVLLHGWAMHSGIWGSVRDSLAQRFRLHLVDLPGHGLSPMCEPGTLEHLTGIVADILPENCMLGGWSLGGKWGFIAAIASERAGGGFGPRIVGRNSVRGGRRP